MRATTSSIVGIGSRVSLLDLCDQDAFSLTILPAGWPPALDALPATAPAARALLGARLAEEVSWPTPAGARTFRITAIDP